MDKFSTGLFWDCDPALLNQETHKRYIIHRVLTRGRWADWKLLRTLYPWETLQQETLQMRDIDPKSLAFASAIFGVPKKAFRCCSKQAF